MIEFMPNDRSIIIDDPALYIELVQFMARYAACIDNDELESWPDFFTDDCIYKIQSRENYDRGLPLTALDGDSKGMLIDRIVSLREANIYAFHHYRHVLSTPLIHSASEDEIETETAYVVFTTLNEGETHTFSAGRYLDKVVRVDGRLLFKQRHVIFDTNSIRTQIVTPI